MGWQLPTGKPSVKTLLEEKGNVEGGRGVLGNEPLFQFSSSRKTRKRLGMKPKSGVWSDGATQHLCQPTERSCAVN